MKQIHTLPLLALGLTAALAAPAAAQSGGTFSLPPNPTPTSTPTVQGPVDDSGIVPVGPRPIQTGQPSPAPTATAAPTPTPAPAPTARPATRPTGQPSQQPTRQPAQAPTTRPTTVVPAAPTPQTIDAPLSADESTPSAAPPNLPIEAAPPPLVTGEAAATDDSLALPDWWWIAALVAALAALLAGFAFWRRKQSGAVPPTIEAPVVASDSAAASADILLNLKIEIDAVRLSRSVMASTLSYRINLSNRASSALRNLKLDGDITSAHGRAPISEQMAGTNIALGDLHTLDHIGAGQRKSFTGDLRLPLKDVRPIQQGNVPVYVPLVRLRVSAEGAEPVAFTFVVGKRPDQPGGRLQPFRLDTPPQTFDAIEVRALT